jgi:hypothetical protein
MSLEEREEREREMMPRRLDEIDVRQGLGTTP